MKNTPTPAQFVKAWKESSTLQQAAQRLKMNPRTASIRASWYRRKGVILQSMPGMAINVNELNAIGH